MSAPLLLLIGLLGGAAACARFAVGAALHGDRLTLVATGLLGSYTTFSTWMFDSHRLLRDGRRTHAALNLAASLALGLLAVWLGRRLGGGL